MQRRIASVAVTMCLAVVSHAQRSTSALGSAPTITPTIGESWIDHLHRSFGETSMGKTGRLGPPAENNGLDTPGPQLGLLPPSPQLSTLQGKDLYRLNCQGCHGENGEGAPPEIHSVIDPVRATSVPLVMERMKRTGMDITPSAAAELAKQSQDALLQRFHSGGESMPAFPHLSNAEIRALLGYLKQLAGVPGAERLSVTETPERVGELIVKSTCHTCHDATGLNPTPQQMEDGAIPPLGTLLTRVDQLQLIRKVTSGAPVLMGTPPTLHRGRMPVFYYLSREEAADVYAYLVAYPPRQLQDSVASVAAAQQEVKGDSGSAPPPTPPALRAVAPQIAVSAPSAGVSDSTVTIVLIGSVLLIIGLSVGAFCFAGYELSRISKAGKQGHGHERWVKPSLIHDGDNDLVSVSESGERNARAS